MKQCFIIGGGPSVNNFPLKDIYSEYVIGVNAAFRLGDWVDVCVFADSRFYKWNRKELESWPNRIIHFTEPLRNKFEYWPKRKVFSPGGKNIFFPPRGANSGAAAIEVAYKLGCKKIYLIGFDMVVKGKQHNFHNFHQAAPHPRVYKKFVEHFDFLAKKLDDVSIINLNPNSQLNTFPKEVFDGTQVNNR